MQYDEIKIKYYDKIPVGLRWIVEQLDNDPEVITNTSREKIALRKFLCSVLEQMDDFDADPECDERNNQDDSIFQDDDIVVGPGKETSTDFMDPPDPDDDNNDGPDFDTGSDFDDGFPK